MRLIQYYIDLNVRLYFVTTNNVTSCEVYFTMDAFNETHLLHKLPRFSFVCTRCIIWNWTVTIPFVKSIQLLLHYYIIKDIHSGSILSMVPEISHKCSQRLHQKCT